MFVTFVPCYITNVISKNRQQTQETGNLVHRAFLCYYSYYVSIMWPNAALCYNEIRGQNVRSVTYENTHTHTQCELT